MFEEKKFSVPLAELCKRFEGSYSFVPPSNVQTIGSFATKTGIVLSAQKLCSCDLSVEIPAEFFTERDFLNYRYFIKRNLYLANVYAQLVDEKKLANAKFEFISSYSSPFKPLLLIKFESKKK